MIAQISVDVSAIATNAATLARLIAPSRLTAVVKTNAYGHGLVELARALTPHAKRLCVYAVEEAVLSRYVVAWRLETRESAALAEDRAGEEISSAQSSNSFLDESV